MSLIMMLVLLLGLTATSVDSARRNVAGADRPLQAGEGESMPPHEGPKTCWANSQQPMLPIFHIIGDVTIAGKRQIGQLEPVNDCSGITYYQGIYHIWHQGWTWHWDHVISKDLIHWQRLPPPIQPVHPHPDLKTWDGSISMLDKADGGPLILYDAESGKMDGYGDRPILGVARLVDPDDKYLMTWQRDPNNPVAIEGGSPIDFPGQVWKNGDYWNFIGQGARFQSNDSSFHTWTRMSDMVNMSEHGGQWWLDVPHQMDGSPPPPEVPNKIVNVFGGQRYLFGNYSAEDETFTPWAGPAGGHARGGEGTTGYEAILEGGRAEWFAAQTANNRMMMIGWALPNFDGDPGFTGTLSYLTLLREVHFDTKTMNLVANPVPELVGLRTHRLASEVMAFVADNQTIIVPATGGGAAASADVEVTFSLPNSTDRGSTSGELQVGMCVLASERGSHAVGGLGITITITDGGAAGRVATVNVGGVCPGPYGGTPPTPPSSSSSLEGSFKSDVPLFDENDVTVRAFPDRAVADFFVQSGRWAGTIAWPRNTTRAAADSTVTLWSNTAGVKARVDVFAMGCGWLNPSYTEHPTL